MSVSEGGGVGVDDCCGSGGLMDFGMVRSVFNKVLCGVAIFGWDCVKSRFIFGSLSSFYAAYGMYST